MQALTHQAALQGKGKGKFDTYIVSAQHHQSIMQTQVNI
jgi:hypothetical protein